ncbi:hypothetical protein RRG08_039357 [Elysia crispata]|uniref:Uncharacterized protein n=1 Tax=Elysia crispata TaxID=231223 RepID=A0AAE0YQX7_9GAST|nr:hypothetical protein RRG08_039357 [Elysia crispata]
MVMNKGVGVYCAGGHKTEAHVMPTADKELEIRFMSSWVSKKLSLCSPGAASSLEQCPLNASTKTAAWWI